MTENFPVIVRNVLNNIYIKHMYHYSKVHVPLF